MAPRVPGLAARPPVEARSAVVFSHVLFDLDGTIADSRVGIVRSLQHGFAAMGLDVPPEADLEAMIGPPLAVVLPRYGVADELVEPLITAYRSRYKPIGILEAEIYPGVRELLYGLAGAGVTLAIATSKPEPFALQVVEHFDLLRPFTVVAGATFDETRMHKHDIIEHALAQLPGATPENAVMVGDRHHDIEGARKHGLRCIGVSWGFGSRDELEGAGAWRMVDTAEQLGTLVTADAG